MEYSYHQFQQAQRMHQAEYGNSGNLYQGHNGYFQPTQDISQFALNENNWGGTYARSTLLPSHRTETKPRLSKGEVAQLEAEFQSNNKPSSSVKKGLAEQMRVDVARINNWFQNRRAKKKQEARAQELERSAKAKTEAESRPAVPEVKDEPSPAVQNETVIKAEYQSPAGLTSDCSTTEQAKSEAASSPYNNNNTDYSSPKAFAAGYDCEQRLAVAPANDAATYMSSHQVDGLTGMVVTGISNPGFTSAVAVPAPMGCSMESSTGGLDAFSYPVFMYPGLPDGVAPYGVPMDGLKREHFDGYQAEDIQPSVETNYPHSASEVMGKLSPLLTQPHGLQSPPTIDIAGRRKRPGLALSGIRSVSSGPALGMDVSRRVVDPGSPMSRAAPATGIPCQRFRRLPSQQRGGMPDWRQESLLQAARPPTTVSPFNSMAPPTPDTPLVATHESIREATVSSSSSEEEGSLLAYQTGLASGQHSVLDQSLRTPPATPVGLGDILTNSIGTTLGYHPPADDSFLATGMEAYSLRNNDFSIPPYVSDGYISQPSTPQAHPMATGYYAALPIRNNAEYGWTDATGVVSTRSSPDASQRRQIQFNNFTPQDFIGGR